MSDGVLIFAINSEFNYIASAEFAASQAKKHLNVPVSLVTTDANYQNSLFDRIIVIDTLAGTDRLYETQNSSHVIKWFNEGRVLAYELTPYDNTLLIDADYFMYNSSLACTFESTSPMLCFTKINDITSGQPDFFRISEISIPMVWATVIFFKKSQFAKSVFDFMQLIRAEWEYYSLLYNFHNTNFRNDFALSIALHTLGGYSANSINSLPGKLHSLFSTTNVVSVKGNEIMFSYNNKLNKISSTNIHCMNKQDLYKFYANS